LRIEGTILPTGEITITKQEPSFNTYPICLSRGILIDTPTGPLPVEQMQTGTLVLTLDSSGNRVAVPVIETSSTFVPLMFRVVRLTLDDGRFVTASPGHPTSEWRPLGDYLPGDSLDRGRVIRIERLIYEGGSTFDLLPAGGSGLYWANGILLGSTLAHK